MREGIIEIDSCLFDDNSEENLNINNIILYQVLKSVKSVKSVTKKHYTN